MKKKIFKLKGDLFGISVFLAIFFLLIYFLFSFLNFLPLWYRLLPLVIFWRNLFRSAILHLP